MKRVEFSHNLDAQDTKRREADLRDYNDAIAGRETGRNTHASLKKNAADAKEQTRKAQLSMLQALLADPVYAAAYQSAMQAYGRAQEAAYDGMTDAANELSNAESAIKETMDNASSLPDGTKVFLSEDGSVFTEKGRKLNDSEQGAIGWKTGAVSWEEYLKNQIRLTDAQKHHRHMLDLDKRLNGLHDELTDEENPPTKDRVEGIEKEFDQIAQDARSAHRVDNELEVSESPKPIVPDLDLGFN